MYIYMYTYTYIYTHTYKPQKLENQLHFPQNEPFLLLFCKPPQILPKKDHF